MKRFAAGIDLGGTRIKIGLVAEGKVFAKKIIPASPADDLRITLNHIKDAIDVLMNAHQLSKNLCNGIGLAFPGLVNPVTKKVLSTNEKYNDAIGLDAEAWAQDAWNIPFFIDNDARMAAVGEWKYGAATDTDNLVVMTIGTGIGTSAIIEGKLLRGKHFQAGCLGGHFSIQYKGRQCNCGNIGCVETYGSTWSLAERFKLQLEHSDSLLSASGAFDFAAVFDAARKKDAMALSIRNEYMDVWAAGIVNLVHAYDPDVVVLGGGVLNSHQDIIPYITEKVHAHAWCPWGKVEIRPTSLLSDAGILGVVHCLEHGI